MSVLITGINGLAGAHLAYYIINNHPEIDINGSIRQGGSLELLKYLLGNKLDNIKLHECDFTDSESVKKLLADRKYDKLFHCAAQVPIAISIKDPELTFRTNFLGTLYLLENIRNYSPETIILLPGSRDEYGLVRPEDNPVNEDCPLLPLNPYGVSKAAQSLLGWQYFISYKLSIIRTRTFSYSGPGQASLFACSGFAKQIASIDKEDVEAKIRTGSLDGFRDYLDIRDIIRAYWLLSIKGEPGEVYNVCSGKSIKMQEILNILIGLSSRKIRLEKDPDQRRPSDIPETIGDNSKLIACTGWEPLITIEKMLNDVYEYWRKHIGQA
jgi:GDP-4-dehydro-6-deoxy-D-mannose reductase